MRTHATFGVGLLLLFAATTRAAVVAVDSPSGAPGQQVTFSVSLAAEGAQVASMQNDVAFDAVQTPVADVGGFPDCSVNPATGKMGFFVFQPIGCVGAACTSMRALLVGFDQNTIPDGSLYSCHADVAPTAPAGSYPLALSGIVLSTPGGQSVPGVTGSDGAIVVTTCGNGALDVGEQCDDGNVSSGDACPADCRYTAGNSAIRGNAKKPSRDRVGCQVEWYVVSAARPLDRYGLPSQLQHCTDQDASCDAEPTPGRCRFTVVACVANDDPALACTPAGIASLTVLEPRPQQGHDAAAQALLTADQAAVVGAFQHLVDPADPGAGYTHAVPVPASARNLCSAPFAIDVPTTGVSRATVHLTSRSVDAAVPRHLTDRSKLRLTCATAP